MYLMLESSKYQGPSPDLAFRVLVCKSENGRESKIASVSCKSEAQQQDLRPKAR
jgi:hypothetical protein